MTERGRHARSNEMGFYRDVLLLIAGIIVVGAIVFGGLSLWAGGSDDDTTTPAASPTSSQDAVTTTSSTTTTTAPTTSTTLAASTTSTTAAAPSTLREARDPSEVRVVVLNSTGVVGLAGQLSDDLAQRGYQMAQADNYTPELSDSMIFHADGFSVEALELAEVVSDATVAPDPDLAAEWGVDLVVVIGQSHQE